MQWSEQNDEQHKLDVLASATATPTTACAINALMTWLERSERIRTQQRSDKNKLFVLHAPEVECIGKGKATRPYQFGVKVSLAVRHLLGLMVAARSFPGNPFDGDTLAAQLEQTNDLMQALGSASNQAIVDLGCRGVDADTPNVVIIQRGIKGTDQSAEQMVRTSPGHRAVHWSCRGKP